MSMQLLCKAHRVCEIDQETGDIFIFNQALMPLNLSLSDFHGTIKERISNINSFDAWCADRVLSIDRRYAKRMLNELGLTQSQSTEDKARISRLYRCLSLQDSYWVKKEDENVSWKDVNLFSNSFSNAFVSVSLLGRSLTLRNKDLYSRMPDMTTNGRYAKAWNRVDDQIIMYKADDIEGNETIREVNASKILDCFGVDHVSYELACFDGHRVNMCECMTNEDRSIVPYRHFIAACKRKGIDDVDDIINKVKKIDATGYYTMNIMTYLIGNSDNHDGNWGFFRDNDTGKLLRIHSLFDFNCAFENYDKKDGGWCIPELKKIVMDESNELFYEPDSLSKTLQEASLEAVNYVDIEMKHPIRKDYFLSDGDYEVFRTRCDELGIEVKLERESDNQEPDIDIAFNRYEEEEER